MPLSYDKRLTLILIIMGQIIKLILFNNFER
jgi:hypothetical protein